MKALIVHARGKGYSRRQIYPFLIYRERLATELGFQFSELPVNSFSEIPKGFSEGYDIVFIQCKLKRAYPDQLEDILKAIHCKKVILDSNDSASDISAPALRNCDAYLKNQILKERAAYRIGYAYKRIHAQMIERLSHPDAPGKDHVDLTDNELSRMRLGWTIGISPDLHPILRKSDRALVRGRRSIEVSFRGAVTNPDFPDRGGWYEDHRNAALRSIQKLAPRFSVIASEGTLDRSAYRDELRRTKICVSPWGHGEVCYRDYEAILAGALLIKPPMDHLEAAPNIYVPGVTYVPVKLDWSDLEEVCAYYLSHEKERRAIAEAALAAYRIWFDDGAFIETMRGLLTRLGFSVDPASQMLSSYESALPLPNRVIRIRNAYTGTFPMVYHQTGKSGQGRSSKVKKLAASVLAGPRQNLGCPEDLVIVTWNDYGGDSILERSCAYLGIPVKAYGIGPGKKWTTNYECKLRLMHEACKNETAKYIMGVDSRDLLILADPKLILDEFRDMEAPLIFGATVRSSRFYARAPDLFRFFRTMPGSRNEVFTDLNAGQWIAEREYAEKFFAACLGYPPRPEKPSSDQMVVAHTFCHGVGWKDREFLDRRCRIFQIQTNDVPLSFFYAPKARSSFMLISPIMRWWQGSFLFALWIKAYTHVRYQWIRPVRSIVREAYIRVGWTCAVIGGIVLRAIWPGAYRALRVRMNESNSRF